MLRIQLLGEQVITDDATHDTLTRSYRTMALVAFLATHAETAQLRHRIAGLMWPDSADAQALTNLRRELHHLRQVLGDEPSLLITPGSLSWRDSPSCRVDVRVFAHAYAACLAAATARDDTGVLEHGTAAVAEYQGDLLPGRYDDWLLDVRAGLERKCAQLCDLLSAAQARVGDLTAAISTARRRVELQPLEEPGYRTLMRLQADLGDRAAAVSTYHRCSAVLERELAVAPDPATEQAFREVVARPGTPGGHPVRPAKGARPALAAPSIVGRAAELGLLASLWQDVSAGAPALALISGGAGVGKTRLAEELAEAVRRKGAAVAASQCYGTPGRLALAPIADWLRSPPVRSAVQSLDPVWRAEAGRLVPSVIPGPSQAGSAATADAWRRYRFFEGLARALLAVGRPLMLIVDNMQWCDPETLAFLTFFLGLAENEPVLVVGTLRDDIVHGDGELSKWLARMRGSRVLTELPVTPLKASDTAQLATGLTGSPLSAEDVAFLHAATGGYPLYVIEAIRGRGTETGQILPAAGVSQMLRSRLTQLTRTGQDIAALAAAAGADFSVGLLAEASDLPDDAVVEAVDELWRCRIIHELGDSYDFSHDLLREAAYGLLTSSQRWLSHRRIAQALELLHQGDTDAVSTQIAEQYALAGQPRKAVGHYRRAAEVAAGLFAHAEAVRLHARALSIVRGQPASPGRDREELSILQAMAAPLNARQGYSSAQLQQTLERSVALAQSLGQHGAVVSSLVGLWASRFVQGRTYDGYRIARQALDLAGADPALCGPAHFALGGSAVSLGRPAEGLDHLVLAAQLSGGAAWLPVGARPDVHATAWAAHAYWLLGRYDESQASGDRAVRLAREIAHPYSLAVALAYSAITCQIRGDMSAVRAAVAELRELCRRYGFAYYRDWALLLDGWSRGGQPGVDLARRGIARLRADGSMARLPYWLSLLAGLLAREGRHDRAQAALDAALAAGHAHDDHWWLPEVMRLRAAYDNEQAAVTRLRSAARMAEEHGSVALARRCRRDVARQGVRC
jgi:DNA-binding SARP family transcriptional activator